MNAPVSVQLEGLKTTISTLKNYSGDVRNAVDAELSVGAATIAGIARNNAPVDEGFLRNSIHIDVTKFLSKQVLVSAFYAAYIEFGTGSNTRIPQGFEAMAAKFKGKRSGGGNAQQFFYMLVAWVLRKGITGRYSVKSKRRLKINRPETDAAYEIAYLIMRKIFAYGIKPHPFLIPAFQQEVPNIIKRITTSITNIKPRR